MKINSENRNYFLPDRLLLRRAEILGAEYAADDERDKILVRCSRNINNDVM